MYHQAYHDAHGPCGFMIPMSHVIKRVVFQITLNNLDLLNSPLLCVVVGTQQEHFVTMISVNPYCVLINADEKCIASLYEQY